MTVIEVTFPAAGVLLKVASTHTLFDAHGSSTVISLKTVESFVDACTEGLTERQPLHMMAQTKNTVNNVRAEEPYTDLFRNFSSKRFRSLPFGRIIISPLPI